VFRPLARSRHVSVWTGSEMLVWGGQREVLPLAAGARYDPATDGWSPLASAGQPLARTDATAVWTGSRMIIWGGENRSESPAQLAAGGRHDPGLDARLATATAGGPARPLPASRGLERDGDARLGRQRFRRRLHEHGGRVRSGGGCVAIPSHLRRARPAAVASPGVGRIRNDRLGRHRVLVLPRGFIRRA